MFQTRHVYISFSTTNLKLTLRFKLQHPRLVGTHQLFQPYKRRQSHSSKTHKLHCHEHRSLYKNPNSTPGIKKKRRRGILYCSIKFIWVFLFLFSFRVGFMPSHLALLSCLLVLVLSLDKFLLHYLKKRWLSGGGTVIPRFPTSPAKSQRSMETAGKWSETAMLVIDMQKDFVDPAMGSPMLVAGGEAVIPAVAEAVAVARERGIFVVWVVREHDPSGRDVELFRRHFYSGGKGPTVKGLKGAELADGLVIKEGEYKLVKTRFSAFFATHLDSVLKTQGIKDLVIVGVQTPNCIRQTVFDAVALNYDKVTVIIDATAAARPDIHLSNIRDMKTIGVNAPTLEEWCH